MKTSLSAFATRSKSTLAMVLKTDAATFGCACMNLSKFAAESERHSHWEWATTLALFLNLPRRILSPKKGRSRASIFASTTICPFSLILLMTTCPERRRNIRLSLFFSSMMTARPWNVSRFTRLASSFNATGSLESSEKRENFSRLSLIKV